MTENSDSCELCKIRYILLASKYTISDLNKEMHLVEHWQRKKLLDDIDVLF